MMVFGFLKLYGLFEIFIDVDFVIDCGFKVVVFGFNGVGKIMLLCMFVGVD